MPQPINPTYIIGLGGTGRLAVQLIKKMMYTYYLKPGTIFPLVKFLAVDTEFLTDPSKSADKKAEPGDFRYEEEMAALSSIVSETERFALRVMPSQTEKAIQYPQELNIEDFIDVDGLKEQLGTIQDGAGGVGVVSKIALVRQYSDFKTKLEQDIADLFDRTRIQQNLGAYDYSGRYSLNDAAGIRLNTMIICSLGGGTGKGLFIPIAATIRQILRQGYGSDMSDQATLQLFNFLPSCFETEGRKVIEGTLNYIRTNQYAAFKELDYVLTPGVGYEPENFLREAFKIPPASKTTIKNLYNGVFNLSPKQGIRGTVGKYRILNSILANYIAMTTFGGQQNAIATDLSSNLHTVISNNPYQESRTGLARNRCYGMVGYYSLKYPVEKMFRWAQLFYTKRLLLDMVDGNLLQPQAGAEKTQHPQELAEMDAEKMLREAGAIFPPVSPIHLGKINCQTVNDPWAEKMHETVVNTLRTVRSNFDNTKRRELRFAPEDDPITRNLFTNVLLDLEARCGRFVKDFGMNYCREYLRWFISEIHESFDAEEWQRILPDRETVKTGGKKGSFLGLLLSSLTAKIEAVKKEIVVWEDRTKCPHYDTIEGKVAVYKALVEKERGVVKRFWETITFSGTIPELDAATESEINKTLRTFNALLEHYQKLLSKAVVVEFLEKIAEKVGGIVSTLSKNIALIGGNMEGKDSGTSLGGDLASEMRQIEIETEETPCILVHGANKAQLESFATRDILSKIDIYQVASQSLNAKGDVVERLLSEAMDKETLRKRVERETNKIHEYKGRFSITDYLMNLVGDQTPRSMALMNEHFDQLFASAEYLGMLDSSVVRGGSPSYSEELFLDLPEPGKIMPFVESGYFKEATITAPVDSGMEALARRNREEIILSKTKVGIALFLFSELYQCGDKYLQALVEGRLGATEVGRDQFLARYHTSKQYFDIPEPFGAAIRVADSEKNAFLNLLFHTGTIRLGDSRSDSEVVKVVKFPYSDYHKRSDYTVLKNTLIPEQEDQRVVFTELERNLNGMPEVLGSLIKSLLRRLVELGRVKKDLLARYLIDVKYPVVPKFVFRELDRLSSSEKWLQSLFARHAETYENQYDERLMDSKGIGICKSLESLEERFAPPKFEMFSEASRLPKCLNPECARFGGPLGEEILVCECGECTYIDDVPTWQVRGVPDPLAQAAPAAQPGPSGCFMTCHTESCANKGKDLGTAKFCMECGKPTGQIGGGGDFLTCHTEGCPNRGKDLGTAKFCPQCGKPTARAAAGGGFLTCLTEGCPNRGKDLGTAKFCGECGKATGSAS